ncbi:alcohol dehydrogenase [Oceanisphaera avium]|uniref:Alcohol dehydrogenase n=2 Tax=Oceanisphaera avium TaxID=1903694 RepID=A0A1Y0D0H9_9GAMM|nr:alcohol dehydrogenase [Oceanisphaera avium]
MQKALSLAAMLVIVGSGVGGIGAHFLSKHRGQDLALTEHTATSASIAKGAYIARTADCVACHTRPGGQPYAGGLAMQTPLGAIYSTNITPDFDTGIGHYSLADFNRAVKHGVTPDNRPLYPAMPYPSYAIIPDEDIRDLYAYFMHAVAPVTQANGESTIPWPLNMRWPMSWWQLIFAPQRDFIVDARLSEQDNRGAYLVEGPGHCGACHTPRGLAYQEKAMSLATGDNSDFLAGAVIDGWRAKSLRGEARGLASWSHEELALFFKTGRTDTVAAFGAMAEVIEHSTRYMKDEDISAMASYLKQLPPAKNKILNFAPKPDTTTALLREGKSLDEGATLYVEHCQVCHRADGKGIPRIFPALAGNSAVFAKNPQSVIQITFEGGLMPSNEYDLMDFAMPAFNHLTNQELVSVMNFIRNGWQNQAPMVTSKQVSHIRDFLHNKSPNLPSDQPITLVQGGSHE